MARIPRLFTEQFEKTLRPRVPLAIHEAGHAFAYTLYGVEVEYASIDLEEVSKEKPEWRGVTVIKPRPMMSMLAGISTMAGPVAGSIASGKDMGNESRQDYENLKAMVDYHRWTDAQRERFTCLVIQRARRLMYLHWETVLRIADVLAEKKRIEGWEIRKIVEDAKNRTSSAANGLGALRL
jgi:hypothetical protein